MCNFIDIQWIKEQQSDNSFDTLQQNINGETWEKK